MYTQEEVDCIVKVAVKKALRQWREFIVQLIRGVPILESAVAQSWIEKSAELTDFLSSLDGGFKQKHLIDLDADPFVPDGWQVEEHIKGGQMEWDPSKVVLYLDEKQKNGGVIVGNKLRKKLNGKPVYNACLLDYLLAHPELIPEEWKGKAIFFWGTIYRGSDGYLRVRYLVWRGGGWHWHCNWLVHDFNGDDPAAVPASN